MCISLCFQLWHFSVFLPFLWTLFSTALVWQQNSDSFSSDSIRGEMNSDSLCPEELQHLMLLILLLQRTRYIYCLLQACCVSTMYLNSQHTDTAPSLPPSPFPPFSLSLHQRSHTTVTNTLHCKLRPIKNALHRNISIQLSLKCDVGWAQVDLFRSGLWESLLQRHLDDWPDPKLVTNSSTAAAAAECVHFKTRAEGHPHQASPPTRRAIRTIRFMKRTLHVSTSTKRVIIVWSWVIYRVKNQRVRLLNDDRKSRDRLTTAPWGPTPPGNPLVPGSPWKPKQTLEVRWASEDVVGLIAGLNQCTRNSSSQDAVEKKKEWNGSKYTKILNRQ